MPERNVTRLFLVRHGATVLSAEDRFAGATDVELSEEGIFQAERLAERLADDAIAAVYSSQMKRTIHTATILGRPHNLTPTQREGLREIHHGHWEEKTRAEVETQFSEEYLAWEEDPYTFAPQGGENGVSVIARTPPIIRDIIVRHRGKNVLIVSHKATLRLLISSVLGFDGRGYRDRLDQSPACLNVLDFKDTVRARLMLFNDISHYKDHASRSGNRLSKWWGKLGE